MKPTTAFKLAFLLPLLSVACHAQENTPKISITGVAQGGNYSVTYLDKKGRNFKPQIDSLLNVIDCTVSLWNPNSLINQVNQNKPTKLSPMFVGLFNDAYFISELTGGAFDITVGRLVKAWGFAESDRENITPKFIDSIKQYTGYKKVSIDNNGYLLKTDPQTMIDFNAIAQGFSSDAIGNLLLSYGITNFLVNVGGGEILAHGLKAPNQPWVVGIEKPTEHADSEQTVMEAVMLINASIVTSGSYRKYYEKDGVKYSHTIDPETGYPVQHNLLSVSVLAKQTWVADGLATAFMVMGMEMSLKFLAQHPEYEAHFVYDDNGTMKTFTTEGMRKLIIRRPN